ncbi:hypothetical protein K1719_018455 [Acacia pycnantha]|nr:hypothetical protein K1719_018455 [Acacia pycnantha]
MADRRARILGGVPTCSRCGGGVEDLDHVLRSCPESRRIWLALKVLKDAWIQKRTRDRILNAWLRDNNNEVQICFSHILREGNAVADWLMARNFGSFSRKLVATGGRMGEGRHFLASFTRFRSFAAIQSIKARQIFDCRSDGTFARAAAPSGASTGIFEALELRDGGSDFLGRGVTKAVDIINKIIAPALVGQETFAETHHSQINELSVEFNNQSDSQEHERLEQVRKFQNLLEEDRGHAVQRFIKSLVLSKSPFSSPFDLHTYFSLSAPSLKPVFSNLIFWACSDSVMVDEAMELYSLMKKDDMLPSTGSVNRLLETLINLKQYNKILDLFLDFVESGIQPNTFSYSKAVQAAVMLKDLKRALELINDMEEGGVSPSKFIYNLVIGGLCKERRIIDAHNLFEEMIKRNLVPNLVTYNTLIDGYCKVGEIESALALRERMRVENVEPNRITYNSLLSGFCDSQRMAEAGTLLQEMEANKFLPDGFPRIIFGDISGGNNNALWDKGGMIDEYTCSILLDGLCRAGMVEKAKEILAKLTESGFIPSKIVYNVLVNAYCQEGNIEKAILTIEQMGERGLEANYVTFNILINKFFEIKDVDQAESWLKKMAEKGVSPSLETYNILINGYGCMNQFDKCFQILEEMEKTGIEPSVLSYGILINCLRKGGKLLEAELILVDMANRGVSPNAEIYNMLIEGSCSMGKVTDALRVFEEMVKNGPGPTLVTYNTLIYGLGKDGRITEAEEFFQQMGSYGYNPDVISYNSLISGYARSGNTQKCLELYDNMKKVGIKPTVRTFHPLINAGIKEGVVTAERLFQEMLEMGLIPDRVVYNAMIYAYAEEGDVEKAMSLHQRMVEQGINSDKAKGVVPNADTYNILVKGYCDLKDFSEAYFWYKEMSDRGFSLNERFCYQLISGLSHKGMLQEAQIVSSDLSCRA